MQKEKLVSFINRYYLAGNTDSVKLVVKEGQLLCSFISSNQNVIGEVTLQSVDMEDAELAVYTTSQLLKMLSVLDDSVEIKFVKVGDQVFSMIVEDKNTSFSFIVYGFKIVKKLLIFLITCNIERHNRS